ncbi:tripartite tricarboxylate transporter TctB family protein [Mangrovicoccus algicola]|uniref:Tripartite tricarboxylate transporter TctB family protein n=1 Tax=Mangrovicoccus algicola TaxID=2771008 RepID=A0A8J6Z159_9RHOB|nr:tripartite tricarboxylate transporter TctB family protein [Mangrovicoccus algicola]MBE3639591.1 tripartite tricarboxylate transporter TctB family protein [Mangrovicoccus algicola]
MQPPIDGSTRKTLAAGLVFLLLCLVGLAMLGASRAAWQGSSMPGDPGPFFLIRLCLWATGAAGAGLLILAAVTRGQDRGAPRVEGPGALALPGLLVLSLLAMPVLMKLLGSAPAVAVFATLWIGLLAGLGHGWQPRRLITAPLFGVGAGIFVQLVFVRLLSLPLPN